MSHQAFFFIKIVYYISQIFNIDRFPTTPPTETQEYKLPEALSLKEQMNGRVVFEVVSEDNEEDEDINDKLTSAYWLSTPVGDEDLEGDQVGS